MAAEIANAVAVFGVHCIRWNRLQGIRRLVLAFDVDEAGRRAIEAHAKQAAMRGVEVLAVTPEELSGLKDIAEAWAASKLTLTDMPEPRSRARPSGEAQPSSPLGGEETSPDPLVRLRGLVAALPDAPLEGLPSTQWMDYRAMAARFIPDYAAQALGWTERDLFGLPDPGRPWGGGACGLWVRMNCARLLPPSSGESRHGVAR